jgi:hypothetical protein
VADLGAVEGTLLALNHHLLPEEERARLLAYEGGPLVLIGRDAPGLPEPQMRIDDRSGPGSLCCLVYGARVEAPEVPEWDAPALPEELMAMDEPMGYWDHFECAPVSPGFLRACARVIAEVSDAPRIIEQADDVLVMATEEADGSVRVALKNKSRFYAAPRVDMRREVAGVEVLTEFPSLTVSPQGSEFTVRIPPEGVTVVEVRMAGG